MKAALIIVVLGGLLIATALLALRVLAGLEGVDIGFHGRLAMTLGIVISLALGGGLMFLLFYSARKGHDDDAHRRHRANGEA